MNYPNFCEMMVKLLGIHIFGVNMESLSDGARCQHVVLYETSSAFILCVCPISEGFYKTAQKYFTDSETFTTMQVPG